LSLLPHSGVETKSETVKVVRTANALHEEMHTSTAVLHFDFKC